VFAMQNYEREGECMKKLCQFCGWEIAFTLEGYYRYKGKLTCDSCAMDTMNKVEREAAR
jgi:superfamily II helicase